MKEPKVSIVVLNYNGKKYLEDCFNSLKKTKYPNFEVVMVDNMSTDDSVSYTKKNFKWVRVVDAGSNSGWSVGNNVGIKNTDGEYVVLLNNDTICTPSWLSEIVGVMKSDPKVGVVGAWPVGYAYKDCDFSDFPYKDVQEAATVSGAAMMIRRDVLDKIGLFEENYFIYWEDTEFTWRSILCGYNVFTNYNSIVYHVMGGHTKKVEGERWVYEKVKNRIHAHLKLVSKFYLAKFLFGELLKLKYNLLLLPYDIIRGNPKRFRSYLKAWIWNAKSFKRTLSVRGVLRKNKKLRDKKLIKLITYDKYRLKRDYAYLDSLLEVN